MASGDDMELGLQFFKTSKELEREQYRKDRAMLDRRHIAFPNHYGVGKTFYSEDPRAFKNHVMEVLADRQWHKNDINPGFRFEQCGINWILRWLKRHGFIQSKHKYYVTQGENPWIEPPTAKYRGFNDAYALPGVPDPEWSESEQ